MNKIEKSTKNRWVNAIASCCVVYFEVHRLTVTLSPVKVREREEYLAQKRAEESEAEAAEDAARRKYLASNGGHAADSFSSRSGSSSIGKEDTSNHNGEVGLVMQAAELDGPPLHSFGNDAEL